MLEEIFANETTFSALTAVLGFLLGVLSTSLTEFLKRAVERDRLIALISAEIHRNWIYVNRFSSVPDGPVLARRLTELKGVKDVAFAGMPEYDFEVYNLGLFQSQGVNLALHLRRKARSIFWETYSTMRDAEAVRQTINKLSDSNPDRAEYQKVFKMLLIRLDDSLLSLEKELRAQRSLLVRVFD